MPSKVIVAFISQKGGVGKSMLARALGALVAHGGLKVRIADLDAYQQTILEWARRRKNIESVPSIAVEVFETAAEAIASAVDGELLIVDTPAHASRATLEIAKAATLIVQPCSGSLDDLRPAVLLFHELAKADISKERLAIALCRILSEKEEDDAREYIQKAGYSVLPGSIPEGAGYRQAHDRGQAITEAKQKKHIERTDELMESLLLRVRRALTASVKKAKILSRTRKEA